MEYDKMINETYQKAIANGYKESELSIKEKALNIKETESQAKINQNAEKLKQDLQNIALKKEALSTQRFVAAINKN